MAGAALQNFFITEDPLSLDKIRSVLVRLEETIIFSIIERSQFAHNPKMYEKGAFKPLRDIGFEGSWLQWFLKETETFHAKARRYTSPDEVPFTADLPEPLLPPLEYPKILYPNTVNVNPSIFSFYTHNIIPRITQNATLALAAMKRAKGFKGESEFEDDGNYGSAAIIDVEVLQGLSKRVHYGKFVSESKFQSHPADFIPHILKPNRKALEALITKPEVERALLARLRKKATLYARELGMDGEPIVQDTVTQPNPKQTNGDASTNPIIVRHKFRIEVDVVEQLYQNFIIPLTKEVEVEYLLQRLDGLTEAEIEELRSR